MKAPDVCLLHMGRAEADAGRPPSQLLEALTESAKVDAEKNSTTWVPACGAAKYGTTKYLKYPATKYLATAHLLLQRHRSLSFIDLFIYLFLIF
jgi:hypothetical protein